MVCGQRYEDLMGRGRHWYMITIASLLLQRIPFERYLDLFPSLFRVILKILS